jgi:hypothetical protein
MEKSTRQYCIDEVDNLNNVNQAVGITVKDWQSGKTYFQG